MTSMMAEDNVRAGVLFDLDETLIDRAASIRRYAHLFWASFSDQLAQPEAEFIEHLVELDGNGYVSRTEFFGSLADEASSDSVTAESIELHYYESILDNPTLIEGAAEGLVRLRTAGVPLGIVTNGATRNQWRKIRNTGLETQVEGCFVSEQVGAKKPDPLIFQSACDAMGLDPERSWFVGDHPLLDICGSTDFGFQSIWVKRSTPWPAARQPCYTLAVESLAAAMDALMEKFGCR